MVPMFAVTRLSATSKRSNCSEPRTAASEAAQLCAKSRPLGDAPMGVPGLKISAAMLLCAAVLVGSSHSQAAPMQPHSSGQSTACEPANGRQGQPGCWVVASIPISPSAEPLYWHVYEAQSAAQERRVGQEGQVIRAHGRTWIVAVAGKHWRAPAGRHVASVGPLQLLSAKPHTASLMEATFTRGMASRIHTHPGPEAWVVLEGQQCLETPEGVIRASAGDAMMVRGGIPMQLFGTGKSVRRALVLIVHPTGEALGMTEHDWRPTGACVAS